MDNFLSDLRYATRGLLRAPGVALIAVVALALGIGLTTIMFSIVYGAMYRGLPFEGAERIMMVNRSNPSQDQNRIGVSIHDYTDWKERQRSLDELGAFYSGTINVTSGERPDRYNGGFLSGNSLAILGVEPTIGRGFTPQDAEPGAPMTLLLGHRAWRDHYGSDPAVIGRTVKVNGELGTVIGVMPEGFLFPQIQEVWIPLRVDPVATPRGQGPTLSVFGKLREGIALDAAEAEMSRIAAQIAAEHPETNQDVIATVRPFANPDTLRGRIDENLWFYSVFGTLFAAFGAAALFMASVGLYGVMSFSVSRRIQEMGIRMALGAQGGQVRALILRQGMTQIGIGIVIGAGLALLVARGLQELVYDAKPFDPATYAAVFTVLALTGLAASAIPAARATRVHPSQALRYE